MLGLIVDELTDKAQNFIQEVNRMGLEVFRITEDKGGSLSFTFKVIAKPSSKKERLFLDSEGH